METIQDNSTAAYLDFHKEWDSIINALVTQLNTCRNSEETSVVLTAAEEHDARLREFPFPLQEEQSAALRSLSDVLDEARFKYTHQRKQEIVEYDKQLQNKIDAWGVLSKPLETPFKLVLYKKGRRNSGDDANGPSTSAKKPRTESTPIQNQFDALPTHDSMDHSGDNNAPAENVQPDGAAPKRKRHVPPITIDNVVNKAALLKHLQDVTRVNLEGKLIGNKLRIFPQTAYAYNHIRKYIAEKGLEAYTYMLPEEKKLRVVIRGLPTDMSPTEIISHLASQNITVEECHIMTSKGTGKPMPLFLINMEKTEANKKIFKTTNIGYMKVTIETLRPKYGPPQCFRCQGFFHNSKFCTRSPRCVKCAGEHLARDCVKPLNDKAKCCLCQGEHPANFLGCPMNPKNRPDQKKKESIVTPKNVATVFNPPAPPKTNFWEGRRKTTTPQQQSNPSTSKNSPQASSSTTEPGDDLFNQLKSPAVQETFQLLEEFIKIATTIPTKYGRLRAIQNLLSDEINI
ncbi:nucleic-acid-binding protein from transposon X-element [Trichonephila clavata]|uniref:Nucleic-acid-binding protein from transposon X-element n=1 Tax=Trichonephila clavata TaxID=2740835 RepID=A0A8X6HRA7_TRICU|nr:nucleic-acid-binding protein from transposon X-element [Trichonephila clavata]